EEFKLIDDHYPPGEIAPVHVIVDTDGEDISLKREFEKHPYVADVADPNEGSENKDLKPWEVTLSIDPYSSEAVESIPTFQAIALDYFNDAVDGNYINSV